MPVLRQVATNIDADYPDLQQLIDNMYETLTATDGVGLAAPQIGLSIRLFVVDATSFADEEPQLATFRKVFINAQIVERKGVTDYFNEGCLSIPGIHEDVQRPTVIRIQYQDQHFAPHDETFDGVAARIIQHEYDHLDGILFTDRVSAIRKQLLRSKLNSIQKGKFEANYKCTALRSRSK